MERVVVGVIFLRFKKEVSTFDLRFRSILVFQELHRLIVYHIKPVSPFSDPWGDSNDWRSFPSFPS